MKSKILALTTLLTFPLAAVAQASADSDGDGLVSVEEFAAAYPDTTPGLFETLDTDESGYLEEVEIAAAQEAGLIPVDDM